MAKKIRELHEYYYTSDQENTKKLFMKLCTSGEDPMTALEKYFSGMDGCKRQRAFCEEEGIDYSFFNWSDMD